MLRISTKVRYATRAMISLAEGYGSTPKHLKQISCEQGIPESYLENLMGYLRIAGLVTTTRGMRGGYVLTRAPAYTRLSEIFTAIEGPVSLVPCLRDQGSCAQSSSCRARTAWQHLQGQLVAVFENTTLQDMISGTRCPQLINHQPRRDPETHSRHKKSKDVMREQEV